MMERRQNWLMVLDDYNMPNEIKERMIKELPDMDMNALDTLCDIIDNAMALVCYACQEKCRSSIRRTLANLEDMFNDLEASIK